MQIISYAVTARFKKPGQVFAKQQELELLDAHKADGKVLRSLELWFRQKFVVTGEQHGS